MINIGDTFLLENPDNPLKHLYFVISYPTHDNKILLVNVTKYKVGKDTSCVLYRGDHPFIEQKSIINYAEPLEPDRTAFDSCVKKNYFDEEGPASKELIKRIQEGAKISTALPKKYERYFDFFNK